MAATTRTRGTGSAEENAAFKKRKVLIVDDHPLVRERVAELINQQLDLVVCGEASDANEALAVVKATTPDMAIIDITLKDTYGIELVKQLKSLYPKLPMLVLSMHEESMYGERALRAGARGYLTKQEASKKIIDAINRILAGGMYVSDQLSEALVQKVAGVKDSGGGNAVDVLTDRELEVFQLLGQGLAVREIADRLFVSAKTIEAHREHIKTKLKFKTSSELLRYAIEYTLQHK